MKIQKFIGLIREKAKLMDKFDVTELLGLIHELTFSQSNEIKLERCFEIQNKANQIINELYPNLLHEWELNSMIEDCESDETPFEVKYERQMKKQKDISKKQREKWQQDIDNHDAILKARGLLK